MLIDEHILKNFKGSIENIKKVTSSVLLAE